MRDPLREYTGEEEKNEHTHNKSEPIKSFTSYIKFNRTINTSIYNKNSLYYYYFLYTLYIYVVIHVNEHKRLTYELYVNWKKNANQAN